MTGGRRRPRVDRGPRPVRESLDGVVGGLDPRRAAPGAPRPRPADAAPLSAATVGTVFSRWEELVGAAVARHARPLRLEGGSLVVAVDQPPWATQLRALAPGILARLNEQTGERFERLDVVVRPPS